jgi:hypothetical protein
MASQEAGCTTTVVFEVRRSAPIPKSDIWQEAGNPPMLAITNRDVNADPSLDIPSTI